MRVTRISVLVLAGSFIGACATGGNPETGVEQDWEPKPARCLRIDRIDNWRVIDSRQLIVYGPRRDEPWHLRLFTTCTPLRSSEVVGFRARGTDMLCGDPGDEILVRGQRCAIRSLRAISPLEAAALLNPAPGADDPAFPRASPDEKEPE
jgi:hypothetical protein